MAQKKVIQNSQSEIKQQSVTDAKIESLIAMVADAKVELDALNYQAHEPIAVIGVACRFPGGAESADEFWQLLVAGKSGVCEVPADRWKLDDYYDATPATSGKMYCRTGGFLSSDVKQFAASFFSISPLEAEYLDPQQRLLLETTWQAIESAGISVASLRGSDTGVFIGISGHDYALLNHKINFKTGFNAYYGTGVSHSTAAGRISFTFDLKGPCYAIDTACSSSLVAVHLACQSLRKQESNIALVGGVNLLLAPEITVNFCQAKMLSPSGRCNTFDDSADGYVRGEGCGMLVLKRLRDAKADNDHILALINGSAVDQDGASSGLTVPNGEAQEALLIKALKDAMLNAGDVSYLEAHGTGTSLGDPIELAAIENIYGKVRQGNEKLTIGSVKTNLGHLEGAAGIASLIKVILMLNNRVIPAHLNYTTPNHLANMSHFNVPLQTQSWDTTNGTLVGAVSSFGFSGTNAHVILSDYKPQEKKASQAATALFTLSAKTEAELKNYLQSFYEFLNQHTELNVHDLCCTTQISRSQFKYRYSVTTTNTKTLIEALRLVIQKDVMSTDESLKKVKVHFKYDEHLDEIGTFDEAISKCNQVLMASQDGITKSIELKLHPGILRSNNGNHFLQLLGKIYCMGANIYWHELHAPERNELNKLSLPTYPFVKQTYWLPKQLAKSVEGENYIQGLGIEIAEPDGSIHFQQKIHIDAGSFLSHHVITKDIIFPATGYLEFGYALAKRFQTDELRYSIQQLIIHRPLRIKLGEIIQFDLLVKQKGSSINVSCYQFKDNKEWIALANWELQSRSAYDRQVGSLDISKQKGMLEVVDVKAFYENLMVNGLHYGESFQTVKALYKGKNKVLAKLEMSNYDGAYIAHPALLDGGLQALSSIVVSKHNNSSLMLPVAFNHSELLHQLPQSIWVYAELKDINESQMKADISYYSESGELLLMINGFIARAMHLQEMLQTQQQSVDIRHLFYRNIWLAQEYKQPSEELGKHNYLVVHHSESNSTSLTKNIIHYQDIAHTNIATILHNVTDIICLIDFDNEHCVNMLDEFFSGLLILVQNLSKAEYSKITLWLMTLNVQLTAELAINNIGAHCIEGFYKTLRAECPQLKTSWINCDKETAWEAVLGLESASGECIVYHQKKRYVQRFASEDRANELQRRLYLPTVPYQLAVVVPGVIDHMRWQQTSFSDLEPQQVRIDVHSSALNFRDVLNVMGLYPGDPGALGMECAGVITECSDDVVGFAVGDPVVVMRSGAMASGMVASVNEICHKPTNLSFEEACAIPSVFTTVWVALHELAKLSKGDTLLIHSAAGGVGLAAIQYAQFVGARLIVTAGNEMKRATLRALGLEHVFNSRDFEYVTKIDEITHGKGVDVVLNYATGDFIPQTLKVTAQGARFIEIGKRDIWSKEKMQENRPDLEYHILAADQLFRADPAYAKTVLHNVVKHFEDNVFKPLPITVFGYDDAIAAFEYMQQSKHVGKVVLRKPSTFCFQSNASYLITGGLGGIGFKLAEYALKNGAQHVVLLSRHQVNEDTNKVLEDYRRLGKIIDVVQVDVADYVALEKILSSYANLKGIFHAAGVLEDALIQNQSVDSFKHVFAAKVLGSWNLHCASSKMNLDCFVMFSSIAGVLGSPGQINYACANAFMDGLAIYRRHNKLPALSIEWGPWQALGMANQMTNLSDSSFVQTLTLMDSFNALAQALNNNYTTITVAQLKPTELYHSPLQQLPWMSEFIKTDTTQTQFINLLLQTSAAEQLTLIRQNVRELLRQALKLTVEQPLSDTQGFFDLGMNSLMAVEFINRIQSMVGSTVTFSSTAAFDFPSINKISDEIARQLRLEIVTTLPSNKITISSLNKNEPIAVIGMSCKFPGARNLAEFWQLLSQARDGITEVPPERWDINEYYNPDPNMPGKMYTCFGGFVDDIERFDAAFFNISPKEAEFLDPQQRMLLENTWCALEHAGIPSDALIGSNTGVYVGISSMDYSQLIHKNTGTNQINAYIGTGNALSTATGRISYTFGFEGPNKAIDTACSSSLVAINDACEDLRLGNCHLAIAGGVNAILAPEVTIGFSKASMLAVDGHCKTFDASADGYVRSEGCGIIILKRLKDAVRDKDNILAVIEASGVNQDGAASGLTVPNGEAQIRLLKRVLANSHRQAQQIDYLEAHGTGTKLGDPIEMNAIRAVYGASRDAGCPLHVASVKTNIGHLEAAAGIAGVIKTVLSLQYQQIPAHLHFKQLNPHINLDFPAVIPKSLTPWGRSDHSRAAAVSAFGFSGTNAHVILSEFMAPSSEEIQLTSNRSYQLIALSSKTAEGLAGQINQLAAFLEQTTSENKSLDLADIAYTLAVGRNHFSHRAAVVVKDIAELLENLKNKIVLLSKTTDSNNQIENQEPQLVDFKQAPFDLTVIEEKVDPTLWKNFLMQLAQSYVNGATIAWEAYFESEKEQRKKIHLPTYVFSPQRYWITKQESGVGAGVSTSCALLPYELSLPEHRYQYLTKLKLSQFPYLADHCVFDFTLFPGSGFVELALAVSLRRFAQAQIVSLNLQAPLELSKKHNAELLLTMTPAADNAYQLQIFSKSLANEDWHLHATAELQAGVFHVQPMFDVASLKAAGQVINGQAIYDRFKAVGLHYGPHFQSVQCIYQQPNKVLAELRIIDDVKGYQCHPALLDGALQSLVALFEQGGNGAYLPISFSEVVLYRSVGQAAFAAVQLLDTQTPDRVAAKVQLLDAEGRVLLEIKRFEAKRASTLSLKKLLNHDSKDVHHWYYQQQWQRQELTSTRTLSGLYWILAEGRGLLKPLRSLFNSLVESAENQLKVDWLGSYSTTDLCDAAKMRSLLQQQIEAGARTIVYAYPAEMPFDFVSTEKCIDAQRQQINQFLVFIQSLTQLSIPLNQLTLYVVTANATAIDDTTINPWLSPFVGLCRSVISEYPELKLIQVDIDCDDASEIVCQSLVQALAADDVELEVGYRQGQRWVSRLVSLTSSRLSVPESPYQLVRSDTGVLSDLRFTEKVLAAIKPDQVALQVHACGLNFRDVLNAMNLYPGNPGPLGGDVCGVITAIGEQVTEFKVGDRVMGMAPGALSSDVVTAAALVAPVSNQLSDAQAASIPTIFMTAYHALVELAKLQSGDKILIHAGTGGVGQAAIQIARWIGAEIYVTAGSDEKHAYLKAQGIKHIYHSRNLNFSEQIMKDTQGSGVDVVLNCLSGEGFIVATVNACAMNARFCEIGKRDIWAKEQMEKTRKDIQYHIIALDQIAEKTPSKIHKLLETINQRLDQGDFKPVNHIDFTMSDSIAAFKFLQQAKHIGKVVITQVQDELRFDPQAAYLITGGLGGIGLELAQWCIDHGAKHICLSTRHMPTPEQQKILERMQKDDVQLEAIVLDVSDVAAVTQGIMQLHSRHLLKGIFHAAGVIEDALLADQDMAHFDKVFSSKILGAWHLHQSCLKQNIKLDYFVCFSSIAAGLGSPGQSNYCAANSFLDGLCEYRQLQGLPAISIEWGPWGEVGMAKDLSHQHQVHGMVALNPKMALSAMQEQLLNKPNRNVAIANLDWSKLLVAGHVPARLNQFARSAKVADWMIQLQGIEKEQRIALFTQLIADTVRSVLGLLPDAPLDLAQGFSEQGMDSLMAVELRNRLQAQIPGRGVLKSTVIFDYPNVNKLVQHLVEQFFSDLIEIEHKKSEEEKDEELMTSRLKSMSDKDYRDLAKKFLSDDRGD